MKLDTNKSYTDIPVVLNDKLTHVDLKPAGSDCFMLFENGKVLTDMVEYDERLDVYTHMSDDGSEFYFVMRVLDENEGNSRGIPDKAALQKQALINITPVLTAATQGQIHMDDLSFAVNIFNSPAFMHKAWEDTGDIDLAHQKIIKDIFRL